MSTNQPPAGREVPTLKKLCAKATPGPWTPQRTNIVAEPRGRLVGTFTPSYRDGDANAQLCARLSPDVALKVYELAEHIANNKPGTPEDYARELLALLDGKAAP